MEEHRVHLLRDEQALNTPLHARVRCCVMVVGNRADIGYGTLKFQGVGELSQILGFTLLIGFVEEVYFRGIML